MPKNFIKNFVMYFATLTTIFFASLSHAYANDQFMSDFTSETPPQDPYDIAYDECYEIADKKTEDLENYEDWDSIMEKCMRDKGLNIKIESKTDDEID